MPKHVAVSRFSASKTYPEFDGYLLKIIRRVDKHKPVANK